MVAFAVEGHIKRWWCICGLQVGGNNVDRMGEHGDGGTLCDVECTNHALATHSPTEWKI